jgi:hypothetical protein
MDRKKITMELAEFLKSKIPSHAKINVYNQYQIRIESKEEGMENSTLLDWIEDFFKKNSIPSKKTKFGFFLKELIFTITTSKFGHPYFCMCIISSEYWDGKELFE